MLKILDKVFNQIINIIVGFAGFLLIFACLSVVAEVIMRYFFGKPIEWVTEVCEYILLYIAFMVIAWVQKENGHIKMDLLLNNLSLKSQALVNSVTSGFSAIICLVITWFATKVTWQLFESHYITYKIIEIPKYIIIMVICIGSLLLAIQFIKNCYELYIKWKTHDENRESDFPYTSSHAGSNK